MACRYDSRHFNDIFMPKVCRQKKSDGTSANYQLAVTIDGWRPEIRSHIV
jgi:hypothetical protein